MINPTEFGLEVNAEQPAPIGHNQPPKLTEAEFHERFRRDCQIRIAALEIATEIDKRPKAKQQPTKRDNLPWRTISHKDLCALDPGRRLVVLNRARLEEQAILLRKYPRLSAKFAVLEIVKQLSDVFSDRGGECSLSIERIVEFCGCKERHIRQCIEELELDGLIEVIEVRGRPSRIRPIISETAALAGHPLWQFNYFSPPKEPAKPGRKPKVAVDETYATNNTQARGCTPNSNTQAPGCTPISEIPWHEDANTPARGCTQSSLYELPDEEEEKKNRCRTRRFPRRFATPKGRNGLGREGRKARAASPPWKPGKRSAASSAAGR